MIDGLLSALDLKDEKRTGWELLNVEKPESVAAHSWNTAFLCLLHAEKEDVDIDKAVEMAVLHDIAEVKTGDIPYRMKGKQTDTEKKQKLERRAIKALGKQFETLEIERIWQEYQRKETNTAKFVKDMDLIDLCIQALKYEKEERYNPEEEHEAYEYEHMDEFFITSEKRLNTDPGRELFEDIQSRYEDIKS